MTRILVVWALGLGILLSAVGLWETAGPQTSPPAAASLFTETIEPELPPADHEVSRVEGPQMLLTQ